MRRFSDWRPHGVPRVDDRRVLNGIQIEALASDDEMSALHSNDPDPVDEMHLRRALLELRATMCASIEARTHKAA